MKVSIDSSVLLYFLNENTLAPNDPNTGAPVQGCRQRIELLISTLSKAKDTLLVPTPALSEALVRAASAAPHYLGIIEQESAIRIVDFDKRAAVEAAVMTDLLLKSGNKPSGSEARIKLKFDVMISAISKINNVSTIYSDDTDIKKLGKIFGFGVVGIADLPLPEIQRQDDLFKNDPTPPSE